MSISIRQWPSSSHWLLEQCMEGMTAEFGLGAQSLNWALYKLVSGHAVSHAGEVAAVKGVQVLKGHSF
jgi:hypothetical protein